MRDIPAKLQPVQVRLRGCAAFLPGRLIRAAPPRLDDLLRQAIGQHPTGEPGLPEIARQLHNGVLVGVTRDVVDQCQRGLARFRREVDRDRVAYAAEKPRLLRGDLTQGLKAKRA
jgi:hypothetical protein